MTIPETDIRWDLVEEHLDEASFLHQLWEEALRSPDYSLAEIAEGPEERLLANLDGVVVVAQQAAQKLLLPALESDESGPAFAATFALMACEAADFTDVVLQGLAAAEPGGGPRAAIRRALSVVPRPDLGARLSALALTVEPPLQVDLLDVLGQMQVDPGVPLEPLAGLEEPAPRVLALRLARIVPGRMGTAVIERSLFDDEESVRAAALVSGMVLGGRGTFAAAETTVVERGPAFATAALLLGLSGDEESLARLVSALGEEATCGPAAFALGFSGRVAAAEALLVAMGNEVLAPLAAEGFAAITGLSVEKRFAKPAKRGNLEEEEEGEEPYGPEADLPRPEPRTIAAWWKQVKPKLDPARRWLRGQPWDAKAVLWELEQGPARRREALALDLAIRTRGRVQLAWDALSSRQAKELAAARSAVAARPWVKSYREGW